MYVVCSIMVKTITFGITKTKNGYSLYCNGDFICEYDSIEEAKFAEEDLFNCLSGKPSLGGL